MARRLFLLIAFSAVIFGGTLPAFAFRVFGQQWPGASGRPPTPGDSPVVIYHINTASFMAATITGGTLDDVITAIENAANTWSNAGANFRFERGVDTTVTRFSVDRINEVFYSTEQNTVQMGGGRAYARITPTTDNLTVDGDIAIFERDSHGTQTVLGVRDFPLPFESDFESLMLHEFGHIVGLDHSEFGSAIMSTGGTGPGGLNRQLFSDDIAGIQFLYGVAPPVPEPTSLAILALGGIALFRRHRPAIVLSGTWPSLS